MSALQILTSESAADSVEMYFKVPREFFVSLGTVCPDLALLEVID